MTEDMLEEHAEMLTQLGSDAEGSQLRARILSASLFSDMEAFKVNTLCMPGRGLRVNARCYLSFV